MTTDQSKSKKPETMRRPGRRTISLLRASNAVVRPAHTAKTFLAVEAAMISATISRSCASSLLV